MTLYSRLILFLATLAVAATAGTTLSSVNPPYIQVGGPDVTLSISGSGFVPGGVVVFGYAGISLSTTYIDSTRISVVLPASISALSGDYQVFVRNPDGSASSTLYFDIQPVLTSVTPNSVAAGSPTTPVTITGIGFVDGIFLEFVTASASTPIYTAYDSPTRLSAFIDASLLTLPGTATIRVIDPAYPVSTTLSFTTTSAPAGKATLTSLVPASVTQGTSASGIQVNGSGFAYGCTAQWNGTPLSTILVNASQLSVQIPSSLTALPGSFSITIVNPGAQASNALTFTVTAQSANARSLSPSSATAGGPAFTLTVNAGGLQNTIYSDAVVEWNGTPLVTTFVSSTQLTAQVPASLIATPGTVNVTIVNPSANSGAPAVFTILPASPPALTSLSPTSTTIGTSAFTLTVSGSNFTSGATVLWNGSSLATTFVSPTQLTAQVPGSLLPVAGNMSITVYEAGVAASNALTFTVSPLSAATLSAIVPSSVRAGSPGFALTVTGTGFAANSVVEWNGAPVATTFVSSTQLTAQIPAGLIATSGQAGVQVGNSSAALSNSLTFTIAAPPPVISSLSPTSASSGGPAFNLTVNGTGFVSGAAVQWNGSSLATTFVSATQLTAQVPASDTAAAGSASVTVLNPGSAPSNAVTFIVTVSATPTISGIAPAAARAGSPTFTLTVTGSNFMAGSVVLWNGGSLPTTFISSTQLTAQVAASWIATPGNASVSVSVPTAASNAAPIAFTIVAAAAPTLGSLSPAGVVAGSSAFSLSVNGSGFVSGSTVQWNGSSLVTTFVSATQLTAQIPAADITAAGSASVTVLNPGSAASNALTFTVSAAAPTLASLSPVGATAGSPAFTLTVSGSGFVSGATVQWNGSPLATAFVSATQLTAQVPSSAVAGAGSASVTVLNPGSAPSGALTFTVSPVSSNQPVVTQVLNAASYSPALAPGTWATIFGQQLAVSTASAPTVPLPLILAEVKSVTVGNVQAPLSYVSPGQINFVIPFEAALGASIPVVVTTSNGASTPVNITLERSAPALFTQNAQGSGMAIAFNANFQPLTSVAGDVIILYAVGLGPTNPPPTSSAQGGASTEPLNRVADQVQVFIGEVPCQVQYAGLAPGFPGIYQLNVIPPLAPLSNRLYIVENGLTSNVTTLPIPVGANVTNVQGSITGLYPASGTFAIQAGNKPTSGPVSFSEMLNAGVATVSFDIRPNAQPFTVVAMGPGATAVLQIDPTGGTWQGNVISPTQVSRVGDFSGYNIVVYDLLSGKPFPGNIIPVSRFDPIEIQAATLLPLPNTFPTTPSPNATFTFASRPLMQSGHFSIGRGQASDDRSNLYFGGFVNIGQPPPSNRTAAFLLFVDGMLVATKDVSYAVQ